MRVQEALSILGLSSAASPDEIKAAYKRLIVKYHPDRNPSGLEMSKSINVAFQTLRDYDGSNAPCPGADINVNLSEEIEAAINAVINLPGIVVELCGTWVWLSGDTKPNKDTIKAAGYRWASKKKMWHWSPPTDKKRRHRPVDMDKIRDVYGSQTFKGQYRPSLTA
jgi:hypothetical protein